MLKLRIGLLAVHEAHIMDPRFIGWVYFQWPRRSSFALRLFPTHLCAFRQNRHHCTVAVVWVVVLGYSTHVLLKETGQRSCIWKPVIAINSFRWSLAKILVDFFSFPKLKENRSYQYIFRKGWQTNFRVVLLKSWRCKYKLETAPCPCVLSYLQLTFVWNSACTRSYPTWFWLFILSPALGISGFCDFSLFLHMCSTIMYKCLGFCNCGFLLQVSFLSEFL